jgi:hypothetical protein
MGRIARVRGWLEANKVFFDVFASVFLGTMAVLVSVAALRVSGLQTALTSAQVAPHIRVASEYVYNSQAEKFTDEVFRIYNDGFALRDFQSDVSSLIQVLETSDSKKRSVFVPTVYLVLSHNTDNSTGLLKTYLQKDNNSQMVRLLDEVHSANDIKRGVFYDLRLINLLSVSYVDALGGAKQKYLLMGAAPGGLEISPEEALPLKSAFEQKGRAYQSIEKLTGNDLLKRLNEPEK